MKPIAARYEGGVLRPEGPVGLRPGERVRLILLREADPTRWDRDRLARTSGEDDAELARAGLAEWAEALDREDGR